jgi:hypothetical protein
VSRIRSIKPEFFRSLDVADLTHRQKLLWIGLWTEADDHGRLIDDDRLIKAALFPLDNTVRLQDVEEDLTALAALGRVVRYQVDGRSYLAVVNWHSHQNINRPGKPKHPAPPAPVNPTDPSAGGYCAVCAGTPGSAHAPIREQSGSRHASLTEDSVNAHGGLTSGREQGREQGGGTRDAHVSVSPHGTPGTGEPPLKCSRHINDPEPPPCPACADARRTRQAWDRDQADRAKAAPTPTPSAPPCPLHPDGPGTAARCPACDAEAVPAPSLRVIRASQTAREAS